MSRLSRRLINEPTWLERDMGSVAYWSAYARVERDREQMLATNPQDYVDQEIRAAQKYLGQGNYLGARDTISILRRLAKERNLTLPEDIDKFHRRILIEGAYGYYREYLQRPEDELDKHMSQYFAEEGGLCFSEVQAKKGMISDREINQILEAQGEGCLEGLKRLFSGRERKG